MREVIDRFPRDLASAFLKAIFRPDVGDGHLFAYLTFRNILIDANKPESLRFFHDALRPLALLPDFFQQHYSWEFQLIFLSFLAFLVEGKVVDANDEGLRHFLVTLNQQDLAKLPELVIPRIQLVCSVVRHAVDKRGVLLLSEQAFKEALAYFNAEKWGEDEELIPAFKLISIGGSEFGDPDRILYFISHQIDFAKTLQLFHHSTPLQRAVLAFYSNILLDVPSIDETPVIGDIAHGIFDNALTCSFQSNLALRLEAVHCLSVLLFKTTPETVTRQIEDPSDLFRCVREQLLTENTQLATEALDLLDVVAGRFENAQAAIVRESELLNTLHVISKSKDAALSELAFKALEKYFS